MDKKKLETERAKFRKGRQKSFKQLDYYLEKATYWLYPAVGILSSMYPKGTDEQKEIERMINRIEAIQGKVKKRIKELK